MAKPRRSTRDEWIDVFSDWDAESQEAALDLAACVHRQTKRQEGRKQGEKAAQPAAPANGQPSLTGLPDENEVGS